MRHRTFTCLAGILITLLGLTTGQDLRPPDQEFVLEFESSLGPDGEPRVGDGFEGAFLQQDEALDLKDNFTLEGWILVKELIPQRSLLFGQQFGHMGPSLWIHPTGSLMLASDCVGQGETVALSPSPLPLKTWLHVAETFSEGKLRIYLEGELQAQVDCVPGWGRPLSALLGPASVAMRQIRFWNHALSAQELKQVAPGELTGGEEGLVAWWPLDDGGGKHPRDLGPHGLDLQLGNGNHAEKSGDDPRWVHTAVFDDVIQNGPFYTRHSIYEFSYGDEPSLLVGRVLMDIDHDGDMDGLFTGTHLPAPEDCTTPIVPLMAFCNDGEGNFLEDTAGLFASPIEGTPGVIKSIVADFTGDGIEDVFITDYGWDSHCKGAQIRLFVGTQSGQLRDETAGRLPATGLIGQWLTAGDIDGDADLDLFLGGDVNRTDQNQNFLLINDAGHFSMDNTRFPEWIAQFFSTLEDQMEGRAHPFGTELKAIFLDADQDGDQDVEPPRVSRRQF